MVVLLIVGTMGFKKGAKLIDSIHTSTPPGDVNCCFCSVSSPRRVVFGNFLLVLALFRAFSVCVKSKTVPVETSYE